MPATSCGTRAPKWSRAVGSRRWFSAPAGQLSRWRVHVNRALDRTPSAGPRVGLSAWKSLLGPTRSWFRSGQAYHGGRDACRLNLEIDHAGFGLASEHRRALEEVKVASELTVGGEQYAYSNNTPNRRAAFQYVTDFSFVAAIARPVLIGGTGGHRRGAWFRGVLARGCVRRLRATCILEDKRFCERPRHVPSSERAERGYCILRPKHISWQGPVRFICDSDSAVRRDSRGFTSFVLQTRANRTTGTGCYGKPQDSSDWHARHLVAAARSHGLRLRSKRKYRVGPARDLPLT